ncbi:MAG: hypothetical protein M3R02_21430 [Chloroflexota bacterium]|nr:hypothetical protein [Chloroflexota bacterium]
MPEIPHAGIFPAGQPVPEGIVPEGALGTPEAASPAAGAPRAVFNPAAVFPSGGDVVDGTQFVNSGLDILRDPAAPFVVTFPTPGTYEYQDLFFGSVMRGRIVVEERGAAVARAQAEIDQAVAEEEAALLERGRALIAEHGQATATPQAGGPTPWDVLAGLTEGQIEIAAFLPAELTIKAGDTVRWTTERTELEVHTATFAGGAEPPELILVEPQEGGPPKLVINPEVLAPAGGPGYRGEGFTNTGFLSTAFPGFPAAAELTFEAPGDYPYYCAIHGSPTSGMRGKITAT